jgi:plastocyanin
MVKTSLLVVVLLLVAGACALPLRAQDASPKTVHVDIKSFKFDPATIEIHPGDIVEWTNGDLAPHTATSDAGHWDTGSLKASQSGSYLATVAGAFPYHCAFHPQMKGRITVVAP